MSEPQSRTDQTIYVASSWRNHYQQWMVGWLRESGFEVYDFRNPKQGNYGFHWSEIDKHWLGWEPDEFRAALGHPLAAEGFQCDFDAMLASHACVLVLPCGRSAHLEAGWFIGQGRPLVIYVPEPTEPELMYRIASGIATDGNEVVQLLKDAMNDWGATDHRPCRRCLPDEPDEEASDD